MNELKETLEVIQEIKEGLNKAIKNTADGVYGFGDLKSNIPDMVDIWKEIQDKEEIEKEWKVVTLKKVFRMIKEGIDITEKVIQLFKNLNKVKND